MRTSNMLRCPPNSTLFALSASLLLAGLAGGCSDGQETASSSAGAATAVHYASPELAVFETFIGVWTVTENHVDSGGAIAASVSGTERITWALDNHAIQRVYTSGTGAAVYRALGMLTWNAAEKKYMGTWFDNVTTAGPLQVTAEWAGKDLTMTYTLTSLSADGSPTRHRAIERLVGEERRVTTTYRLDGADTQPVKVLEIEYRRATPCPSTMRGITAELSNKPGL